MPTIREALLYLAEPPFPDMPQTLSLPATHLFLRRSLNNKPWVVIVKFKDGPSILRPLKVSELQARQYAVIHGLEMP